MFLFICRDHLIVTCQVNPGTHRWNSPKPLAVGPLCHTCVPAKRDLVRRGLLRGAQEAAEAALRAKQDEQAKLERQERPAAEPSVHAGEASTAGPAELSRASSTDESTAQAAPLRPNGVTQVQEAALPRAMSLVLCHAADAAHKHHPHCLTWRPQDTCAVLGRGLGLAKGLPSDVR